MININTWLLMAVSKELAHSHNTDITSALPYNAVVKLCNNHSE